MGSNFQHNILFAFFMSLLGCRTKILHVKCPDNLIMWNGGSRDIYIVMCQVHPVLVKRVQCTVRSSFLNSLVHL